MNKVDKISRNEWIVNATIFLFLLIAKIIISFYMKSAYIFSDEQSYFGMMDKIAHFGFDTIRNSHGAGFPLLAAPIYALASDSVRAYHGVLILNCVIGTLSYPLVFYLCKIVFKLKGYYPVLVAFVTSLASSLFAYNYTVMSETTQTIFYLVFFVLFCDLIFQEGQSAKWKYILLGIVLGFIPIIKIQAIIILTLYVIFVLVYQITEGRLVEKKWLLASAGIAVVLFFFFRCVVFSNASLYEEQTEAYSNSILAVFASGRNFLAFMQVLFSELSYFVVATGVIPFFLIIDSTTDSIRDIVKDKEKTLTGLFALFVFLGNILIASVHAYTVFCNSNVPPVYARYIDFMQPMIIAIGLILLVNREMYKKIFENRKVLIIAAIMAVLVFIIYPSVNKIAVNTYSIHLFQQIPLMAFIIVFCMAFTVLAIFLKRNNTLWVSVCFLTGLYLAMDYSAVKVQLGGGNQIAQVYNAAYYVAENSLNGQSILLDSDMFGINDGEKNTFRYMVLFWGLKNNEVGMSQISKDNNSYIYTDKLLTREALSTSGGFILYDKENCNYFNVISDTLFRTSSNTEVVSQDVLRVTENEVDTRLFIDNISEIQVAFNYAENVEVFPEEDTITCYINGIQMERVREDGITHRAIFKYNGNEPIVVESLSVEYGGKYLELISEGIMYWNSMDISYQ